MPWLKHEGSQYWIGRHTTFGLLVFTAKEVRSAGPDISGFNVLRKELGLFKIAVMKTKVRGSGITEEEAVHAVQAFVDTDLAYRPFNRVTHCWS